MPTGDDGAAFARTVTLNTSRCCTSVASSVPHLTSLWPGTRRLHGRAHEPSADDVTAGAAAGVTGPAWRDRRSRRADAIDWRPSAGGRRNDEENRGGTTVA